MAYIKYVPVSAYERSDTIKMIQRVKLSLTDKLIHMGGGLLLDEDRVYDI